MSDQMNKAAASKAEAEAKGKNLGQVNTSGGFGAGAGGGFGLNKPGHVKVENWMKRPVGVRAIEISDVIANKWLEVLDDDKATSWVVTTYSADGKSLELKEAGEGGLKAFKEALPADQIAWGGLRVYGVDKRGSVECKRAKLIFVAWFPSTVSQIKKGKAGPHKGEINETFGGTHCDLRCEELDDFNEVDLIKKLQASTGAHKPNGYEFEAGVFSEADFYGLGIGTECKGETKDGYTKRASVAIVTQCDEDRPLNQKRASNMADTEQLRRVAEIEHVEHEAKVERKKSQELASAAMDEEQSARVVEDTKAPRKSASFVPDMADLEKKAAELEEVKTDEP